MVSAPTIELSSLSMADSLILMVLALVVFGPRRLPQIGRQIGKLMYEFRKASNDFKFQMEEELRNAEDADRRKREEAERQLALSSPAQSAGTIEAQAGFGTTETATLSPYPGEGTYPREYPPETPAAAGEPSQPAESSPYIHPPTTGRASERCSAERCGRGDKRRSRKRRHRFQHRPRHSSRRNRPRRTGRHIDGADSPSWLIPQTQSARRGWLWPSAQTSPA